MTSKAEAPAILTLRLKPREEERILAGHLWVFSNELVEVPKDVEPGCLAAASAANGRPLGVGFYNPHSLIAWRQLAREPEAIDQGFFARRLRAAMERRERLYPGARSYRLCFGESDGLPGLVADRYEDFVVLQILSAGMERRLDLVGGALRDVLSPKGVYLNNEHPARALEELKSERRVLFGDVPAKAVIEEEGLKFITSLTEGQKTGFYFDQRENRRAVSAWAKGRKVLDLYCYTGAFGLHAAKAGAAKVLGLDSSGTAAALANENAKANGLESLCQFDEGDAEEVLVAFSERRDPFFEPDMVLLDPPSFVPSKKHLPKALRAYLRLNSLGLKALRPGGVLATSTCSHHVGREDFLSMLRQAAAKAGRRVRLLELRGQAQDHPILLAMPETEYLHFALLEVIQ